MWWVVKATPGRFTHGEDPVPIIQEAGWTPELVIYEGSVMKQCIKLVQLTNIPTQMREVNVTYKNHKHVKGTICSPWFINFSFPLLKPLSSMSTHIEDFRSSY
jgi:hypothetical protein